MSGVVGSLFTAAQWEELGRQALIYKHLAAGVPVPPDLLLPLRAAPASLYYHPTLGYLSCYGKKLDPEPGRCRRTDGKKWRCSKDAHPDSKYCERHMHRSRNRSRKPVENKALSQSQSSSSAVMSRPSAGGTGSGSGNLGSVAFQHSVAGGSYPQGLCSSTPSSSQWQLDPGFYTSGSKEYRCLQGVKTVVDEHSFFAEASGSARGIGMDSSVNSSWRLMPSEVAASSLSKASTDSLLQSNYPQLQSLQDLGQPSLSSLSKEQQQHSFFGAEFGLSDPVKHENRSPRPFFNEWPRTRDLWSDLENERSNRGSFSITQLSISIPNPSSDFSTTDSRSTNGVSLF